MVRLSVLFLTVFLAEVVVPSRQDPPEVVGVKEFQEATSELIHIDQLIADPNGGGWVLDSQVSTILRLEPTGQVRTLGRTGSGPGEYRRPWRLSLVEDTLWVVDLGLDRIIGIDPQTGDALGNINGSALWRQLPEAGAQSIAPLGMTAAGILVAIDEPTTSSVALVILSRDRPGDRRDLFRLDQPDADLRIQIPGHPNPIRITNPFSNSDLLALGNYGRYVGRVLQLPVFQTEVVDLWREGDPTVTPWPSPRGRVTHEEHSEWLSRQKELAESLARRRFFASQDAALEAIGNTLELGTAPVVRRLTRGILERSVFIDGAGDLWFDGWSSRDSDRQWFRVSSKGRERVLSLRGDEELLDLAGHFVWKQRLDALGVPHLVRVEFASPLISAGPST